MNLSGAQEAQLQSALVSAFPSRFAVEQFVRYALDQNLNALAGDVGLSEVVFRVIEWAKTQGRMDVLVQKARLQNPNNSDLKAFVDQLAGTTSDPVVVLPRSDRGAAAVRGLQTLEQLMLDADVRESVGDFQSVFEAAALQIEILAFYKDLHDLLHTLQFQCYRGITQEAKRFPEDPTSREILADHEITLSSLVQQLNELSARDAAREAELSWLQDLRDAQLEFQKALQDSTAQTLARAIRLLDRVLAVQPSHINTRLNAAARGLRLGALVQALTLLRDRFVDGGLDPEKVQTFTGSIKSLGSLQTSLTNLVIEHDRWQALDLDLRRIQQNLQTDELELSWDRVQVMIKPLVISEEPWATVFRGTCEAMAQCIATQDKAKERQIFQRLYAQASDRFYRVDTSLKRVCESLRVIGEPLTTLLGLIK